MRILLLGGTGFIGREAAHHLRAVGHEVVTASRSSSADLTIDAMEPGGLARLVSSSYDSVVNLLGAGLASGAADPRDMRRVNSELPRELVLALASLPSPPHLLHAASSTERLAEQATDESDYSRTKHDGTTSVADAATAAGTPVTILRIHNTYGPTQPSERFVAAITAELRAGRQVTLNFPERVRDFVYVSDVAASIRHALEHPPVSLSMAEAGSGTGLTLTAAARGIAVALGRPTELVTAVEVRPVDPNPVTVCPVPHGTYGLCTTDFASGIRQTLGSN